MSPKASTGHSPPRASTTSGNESPTNGLRLAEEGRKATKKDPDQEGSDTENTSDDHVRPVGVLSYPTQNRIIFALVCLLCTVLLAGLGVTLAFVLPKVLVDKDSSTTTSSTSDSRDRAPESSSSSNASMSQPIGYDYVSDDTPDSRDGGFFADTRGTALQDGFTDVLQGGKVLAWPHSPDPDSSTHRVVFDLNQPQPIRRVNVTGIVLGRWGLNAPVSLRLQLEGVNGRALYEEIIYTTKFVDDGAWNVSFDSSNDEGRNATQALLDVACPLSASTVNSLNMKCGISEVVFLS